MVTRWEGDDRGRGVGDAAQLVSGASELVSAFRQAEWVAEQPEAHLLPHVEAWCQRDRRLALTHAYSDDAHAYILEFEWCGPHRRRGPGPGDRLLPHRIVRRDRDLRSPAPCCKRLRRRDQTAV